MISAVGLIGLLVLVYWCRNFIQKHLQGISFLWGIKGRGGLWIYTMIFLPGIILHEMAHFFMAAILGVRTGEIHLFPKPITDEHSSSTALGSVQVAKSDALRGSLIGAAPFIAGSLAIYLMVNKYFFEFQLTKSAINLSWNGVLDQPILIALLLYLIFVIGNTMFSSKEDTRSWPLIMIMGIMLVVVGYVSGNLNGALEFLKPWAILLSNTLLGAMAFVVVLDLGFIGCIWLIEKVSEKLLKRRVRYGV